MPEITIQGKTITVDDSFMQMSPEQQNDAVEEIAASLGVAPVSNDKRIEQAHDASGDKQAVKMDVLPFSYLRQDGETVEGSTRFDLDAGLTGALKSAMTAPGDVMTGKLQPYLADGTPNPEFASRAFEAGAMIAPASTASRLPAKLPKITKQQEAVSKAEQRVADADEFGVQLTKGQATEEVPIQQFEEDALTGGRGLQAQQIMTKHRDAQKEQIDDAMASLTERMAPNGSDDAFEIADNLGAALKAKADAKKKESQNFYDQAEQRGAEIKPEAVQQLSGKLRETLNEAGAMEGKEIASDMPNVRRIMKRVDDLSSLKNAPEGEVIGVGWQNVERIRRQLVKYKGNDAESVVVGDMKKAVDNWIEDSVINAMASGDKAFLSDLKNARAAWRMYKSIEKNPKKTVAQMAKGELDSVQIANVIYGTTKVGGRSDSAGIVREIKSLIGENHPAITDLRRGVMLRLFNDSKGEKRPLQTIAGDILELTNGKGRELFKSLFGEQHRLDMVKFANVIRYLKPDNLSGNPSRSGQTVMRRFSQEAGKFAPLIGLSVGDITGMIAGYLGQKGMKFRAGTKARDYIENPAPVSPQQPSQLKSGRHLNKLPFLTAPNNSIGQGAYRPATVRSLADLLPPGTA